MAEAKRFYKPKEKLRIVLEGLSGTIQISELCRKYDIKPVRFYHWEEKHLQSSQIFDDPGRKPNIDEKIRSKDEEIARHKDVIAEITPEKTRYRITARKVLDSAPYIMSRFAEDLDIASIMIVLDRGFFSRKNILDLRKYSLLGAIPATLSLYRDLLSKSRGIENSRNHILSGNDTIFHMEHSAEGTRYIVFFSLGMRAEKVQAFYSRISDTERDSNIG